MKSSRFGSLKALFCLCSALASTTAMAVGDGDPFGVNEGLVAGSNPHPFSADSIDLTYHACSNVVAGVPVLLNERGYFWMSSYQDNTEVMDSQINYYRNNGYHIYGVYEFASEQVAVGVSILGNRRGYQMTGAKLSLYLDPNKDTTIGLPGCEFAYTNTSDDKRIGYGNNMLAGEKSEKDGLANGDFQFVLDNWTWVNPIPLTPFAPLNSVTLNANVTQLGGPLDNDHKPEGSGNIFWRND